MLFVLRTINKEETLILMGNYIKNSYKDNLLCRYSYGTCI